MVTSKHGNMHLFYKCDRYEEMTGTERIKLVKKENLCFNSLKRNHNADKCSSKNKCFGPGCAEHHQYMTTSRKKLMTMTRRTQRYVYPRMKNTKQSSFRLYQLKKSQNAESLY